MPGLKEDFELIDGELIKPFDPPYKRQVTALHALCEPHPGQPFVCNPAALFAVDQHRLFYMGCYPLDNNMRALGAKPLMLTDNTLLANPTEVSNRDTNFSHAVLVRIATAEESALVEGLEPGRYAGCLELLKFAGGSNGITWFTRTGITQLYQI